MAAFRGSFFVFFFFFFLTIVSARSEPLIQFNFTLAINYSSSLSPLTIVLGKLGFTHFALASQCSYSWLGLPPPRVLLRPLTVFAPFDVVVRTCISCFLDDLFLAHSVPGLYHLHSLRFGSDAELRSGIPHMCLTVSSDATTTTFFIGGAEITHPDLFVSEHFIVHGIRGLASASFCSSDRFPPKHSFSARIPSPLHETVLVVTLDGIVSLVEIKSQKILWSIQTGRRIYSSYQAPEISYDNYVDCGDDWVLYRFDRSKGNIERLKSAKDLIRETNRLSENGVTVIAQMDTTVFVVQAETGTVSRVFGPGNGLDTGENLIVIGDEGAEEISITRIDYSFVAYSKVSGDMLWNISLAEFVSIPETQVYISRDHFHSDIADLVQTPLLPKRAARVRWWFLILGTVVIGPLLFYHLRLRKPKSSRKKKKKRKLVDQTGNPGEVIGKITGEEIEKEKQVDETGDPGEVIGKINGKKINKEKQVDQTGNPREVTGKITVTDQLIAEGSNGTMVFAGTYEDDRPVVVKRFLREGFNVTAEREIKNLIHSDQHPNVVRYHGVEKSESFIYVALERCDCSLSDLVHFKRGIFTSMSAHTLNLLNEMEVQHDINLWKKTKAYPCTPHLQKVMRDIVLGVSHLHQLGIIHRDLKPQNILLIKEKDFCAKIADMGISKKLSEGKLSLTQATGSGTSGWRAPEQLHEDELTRVETRAVDLFTLGLVLFYSFTKGEHPFGDEIHRDVNIENNNPNWDSVKNCPEAMDLFPALLARNPQLRPSAHEVLHHPLFWDSEMRLSFFRDVSGRLDSEARKASSLILAEVERSAALLFSGQSWYRYVDPQLIHRRRASSYNFQKVSDLVRFIRNTLVHHDELPSNYKVNVLPLYDHFDEYFRQLFPDLFIVVYSVIEKHCKGEQLFCRYFS